ncbi:MAG: hypothetical protein R6V35_04425 [Candidatus Nanohaloarchaea archaeon]
MDRTDFITGNNPWIEKNYDYGVIGNRNTYTLNIDTVIKQSEAPIIDEATGENIDDKLIYAHPSQLPMSHGTTTAVTYSGKGKKNHRYRDVTGPAQLFVAEEPPFEMHEIEFDDVNTFLVGDEKDSFLSGEHVSIQARPSRFH